jgi:drug/metabolite transporter (DMT)-like permease
MKHRVLKADGLLLLTAAIWGAAFVAQRVGMDHMGPMTFNGVRFALGALVLLPLARKSPPALANPLTGGKALLAAAVAGIVLFLGAGLQQWGLVYTTAGKAGFITGLYVIIVPLLGLFFRQRPGAGTWVGAGMAVIGLYLLSVTESLSMQFGDFLVLLCAFAFAAHVLIIGWLSPRMHSIRLSVLQFAACSILSFLAAFAVEDVTWAGIWAGAIPIAYGGLMSVGVAYTLQVVAQKDAKPAHAAIILSLEGMFAALTGWLLLDELMSGRMMLGCGLMLAGMLAAQLGPGGEAVQEEAGEASDQGATESAKSTSS